MINNRPKSYIWLLAISILIIVIMTSMMFSQPTGAGTYTDRIAGADRYQTAVSVSQKGWKSSDYAVLARGDNFADALCAGPLAHKYGGPILLTQSNQLNNSTLAELKRLGVKHLFIAGGTGAVSQNVENALKAAGIQTVERINGADRYETSVKIAEKVDLAGMGSGASGSIYSGKVVLATGSDFPDALSVSGIAAKLGMPILLTGKNNLPSNVSDYFNNNTVTQTYVVGGTGVISNDVADSVPGAFRLGGSDRYATNVAVLQHFAGELNFDNIYVAIGTNFADALTGAVLAAKSSAPLILTGQTLPAGTSAFLHNQLKLSTKVLGLGGKAVVPSAVLNGLVTAKEQTPVEEKYSTAGTYGPETGTKTIQGSVIISAADVTLRNTIIEGDLLLGRSIGDGDVELRDVTVKGKTIVNGGGPNSVIMYNFNGQTVIVDVPDGASVRLVAQGSTHVGSVSMEGNGTLEESDLTGAGFINVAIPAGAEVVLNGNFSQVDVEAAGANVTVKNGTINTFNITESAGGAQVNLANGTSVATLNVNAQSNVSGQGQISAAYINANGVTIVQTPGTTILAQEITVLINNQQQNSTSNPPPSDGGSSAVGVDSIELTTGNQTLAVGESLQLTAVITPANATNKKVVWTSSNDAVVTVSETGRITTGADIGEVTITVTTENGEKTDNIIITVVSAMNGTAGITGTPKFNETLTADIATLEYSPLTGADVPTYQWKREGIDIDGSTASTYTLQEADIGALISLTVTADGTHAKGSVTSNPVGPIEKADTEAPAEAPSLLSKTATRVTLVADERYQFCKDDGEWQDSHVFTDLNALTEYIFKSRYKETSTHNASGPSSGLTVKTSEPVMSGTAAILGDAQYGSTLTVDLTGVSYTPPTVADEPLFQWYRNSIAISGAVNSTYTLTEDDIDSTIHVHVEADGIHAVGSAAHSPATAVVAKVPGVVPPAPMLSAKTATSITLESDATRQFRIDDGEWQDSSSFADLDPLTDYTFQTRSKETSTHRASAASQETVIKTNPPVMSGTVSISGTHKLGQVLTANIAGLVYTPATESNVPAYQWKRDGLDIEGASLAAYTLTEPDIDKTISVSVTADGIHATGSVTSEPTEIILKADGPEAPEAPGLESKSARTITLSANALHEFSKDGGTTWQDNVFTGLTLGTEYTFIARVKETATHEASASSPGTTITTDAPMMGGSITINGTAKYGELLTADLSGITYTPAAELYAPATQWNRDGDPIFGGNGVDYFLTEADIGTVISMTVTADGIHALGSVTSAGTAVIKADGLAAPAAPELASKRATVITLVENALHEFSINNGVSWQESEIFSSLNPSTAYTLKARIKETATHLPSQISAGTLITTNDPSVIGGSVIITGTAKFGEVLSADITGLTYTPATEDKIVNYQWKRNGANIAGATAQTYTQVQADIGAAITLTVSGDGMNTTGSVTSPSTSLVTKADGLAVTTDVKASYPMMDTIINLRNLGASTLGLEAAIAVDGMNYGAYFNLTVSSTGEVSITGLTGVSESSKVKVRRKEAATTFAGPEKEIAVTTPEIGDRGQAGGWVFYVNTNYVADGWRYLEASPTDASGTIQWGDSILYLGVTDLAVGAGKTNTALIIERLVNKYGAAVECDNFVMGGKDDWFLPSFNELTSMYQNLHRNGIGGFVSGCYWSSSEYSISDAWCRFFGSDYSSVSLKHMIFIARPVRSF